MYVTETAYNDNMKCTLDYIHYGNPDRTVLNDQITCIH